ncbi:MULTISPECIES: Lrp/AsnC family transcriptional regulator [Cellulophaga]|uniref:Transcriptional regulator, AsnC family n=2 Tax=Cellulophaga TaxID=104264 RepID=F0RBG4_CELLC|nr:MULTISPECIES: Lrp/AsnC family transcriptional regulator [Cellulophaga]ADY29586.1 transcriptional regulator, AsnC family [Cellulophaga lytica DSM 7489]AIM60589.1 AsnC family transcriptional regulator [Cellulophaga lytica]APU10452.1 AsnC family transcriptional regulator [Cellulophaga lytica]EWH12475.1 AsnC family transcriptional regulator [Cellulophaga geojensis KL-A]MDO6852374.1 Lrp/AsnC family transcriptional regulator [Cellulophaga lytica]
MDAVDKKILMLLQQNAKQNTKEIADKIGLTVSPTFERIKKLEQQNYIKGYVALLNEEKINKAIKVYCHITLATHSRELIDNFKNNVAHLPEIMSCQHLSGNYDFLLKVAVSDMTQYQQFVLDKLSVIKGISNVQSSFVLEEIKNDTAYVL